MPKIFISFIFLGFSLFLGVIFLWPRYERLDNLWVQIENKELDIQYQDEYYKNLSSLSEELKKHQPGLAKIDSALPSDPQLLSLLKFLQDVTMENGLILTNISSFSIKPLFEATNIKEIQGSLELVGSYPALKNFLTALEKSARLIRVNNISFSAFQESEGEIVETSKIFNFSLTITTNSY